MILDKCFEDEYIISKAGKNISKKKNFERVLFAFCLLEELSNKKVDFVFKGGTSLMLLLDDFDRFSVDIDIIMNPKYEKILIDIVSSIRGKFHYFEEDIRRFVGINKRHFKFFYKSRYTENDNEKSYILLDVVFEEYKYDHIECKKICSHLFETSSENYVNMLNINSLLGDKLTAFAPRTIGILYSSEESRNNKNTEIIKQLYDISKLFDKMTNLELVRKTYFDISNIQIKNRNLCIDIYDCLNDTINTCKLILTNGKVFDEHKYYEQLKKGFDGFKNYCINILYFDELLVMASKVYILCQKILFGEINKRENKIDIRYKELFFAKNFKLLRQLLKKEIFEELIEYSNYELSLIK